MLRDIIGNEMHEVESTMEGWAGETGIISIVPYDSQLGQVHSVKNAVVCLLSAELLPT